MRRALEPGDEIELAITVSQDYQVVRAGATSTIREGESTKAAYKRIEDVVADVAIRALKTIT